MNNSIYQQRLLADVRILDKNPDSVQIRVILNSCELVVITFCPKNIVDEFALIFIFEFLNLLKELLLLLFNICHVYFLQLNEIERGCFSYTSRNLQK